jgi:hypothetical protein
VPRKGRSGDALRLGRQKTRRLANEPSLQRKCGVNYTDWQSAVFAVSFCSQVIDIIGVVTGRPHESKMSLIVETPSAEWTAPACLEYHDNRFADASLRTPTPSVTT